MTGQGSLRDVVLPREGLIRLEPCPVLDRIRSLGVTSALDAEVVTALVALDLPRLSRLECWTDVVGCDSDDNGLVDTMVDGLLGQPWPNLPGQLAFYM